MGESLSWSEVVASNLTQLINSTTIGVDLVARLLQNKLINDEEKHLLMDSRTPNSTRAMRLYTNISTKWNDMGFEHFKTITNETGNQRAFEILTSTRGHGTLITVPVKTHTEMKLFKRQMKKEGEGQYEGISLEEEMRANRIVDFARKSKMQENGELHLADDVDRNELISLLKQLEASLKNKNVWWNPKKAPIPRNHIPRKICSSSKFDSDGLPAPNSETKTLLEVMGKFVLLVDSPGMGKSTEMTQLEQNLRRQYEENRIVVRINLNEVQETLSSISRESAAALLVKLAPFIPSRILQTRDIQIFVLLDALDEVCPTHQATMLNLLRIFNFSNEPKNLHVILTTRPHLREAVEVEFDVESFSLVPLSPEEQNSFLESELNYSSEHLQKLRKGLSPSLLELLGNPLMLFMLVDVLKSEETFGAFDLNLFELYSRFVEAKHKLHLVEKEGMKKKDNSTEVRLQSTLTRNLPFYYHVAWNELLRGNSLEATNNILPPAFTLSIGLVAEETSGGPQATELLSCGLLVERGETKRLFFKHRSFAEFFYARLLLLPQTPQGVRDTLFGFIYGPIRVLENVEEFVGAALSNGGLQLQLTTKWLLITKFQYLNSRLFVNFVGGSLFPLLAREVLTTFVEGDPDDLWDAFQVLVAKSSRGAFVELVGWMEGEEREWSRRLLRQQNNDASRRLTVAIGLTLDAQSLLNEAEVAKATETIDRLISTLTPIHSDKMNKWEFVGSSKFRKLIQTADSADLFNLSFDVEATWKLFSTFSREELHSLFSNEETRRTDLVGWHPLRALVSLGEEFVPSILHLAEFRPKFGKDAGKTVFELSGCDFVLGMLWEDLLKETEEKRTSVGPITIALREAVGKRGAWELLGKLEAQIRRRRSHPLHPNETSLIEWVVLGGRLFDSLPTQPLPLLPFVLRYSSSPDIVTKTLEENEEKTEGSLSWEVLLKSLLISSHTESFPQVASFLRSRIHFCPTELEPIARLLLSTQKEQLQTATPPSLLVSQVSVGQAILALLTEPLPPDLPFTWIVSDVIRVTRCCDLRAALSKLTKLLPEKKLREILLSDDVLFEWNERFTPIRGRKEEFGCGLEGLLTFYFSVFGLNLDWMEEGGVPVAVYLLAKLPVELATVLEGNPNWRHLLPQFETSVATTFSSYGMSNVNKVVSYCFYLTEGEWERLIRMVGDEATQLGTPTNASISSGVAAVLLRTLIRRFGVEETNQRMKCLWEQIPNNVFVDDTVESMASLLHCAIQLGELEEVERRGWPGLLLWRNPTGRNALDVAREELREDHPITTLLKERTNLLKGKPALNEWRVRCVVS